MSEIRTATWKNLGESVSDCSSLESVLKRSGLDFNVVKKPIYTGDNKDIIIPNLSSTIIEGTDHALGIVSNKYQICQNRDAFDFINYMSEDIKFVTAGITTGGLVYIIARLDEVNILGDKFRPHVIFQNGFNGGISIKAAICPLRIVCQNQFNISFKETNNSVSIRHTSTMQDKLVQAREVLRNTADYMKILTKDAEKYANIKLSSEEVSKVINDYFPTTDEMSDRQKNTVALKRAKFITAYNEDDNSNFRGTAWGMINAASDYFTHYLSMRNTSKSKENKFMYVTFTPILNNFIEMLMQRV